MHLHPQHPVLHSTAQRRPRRLQYTARWLAAALALGAASAQATEGGGSIYPVGAENFGCCALPPPGLYGMAWGQAYTADELRDNDGDSVAPPDFEVSAYALVSRLVWITPVKLGSAALGLHAIVPAVDLDVQIAPGLSDHQTGIGDTTLGAVLGWAFSPRLHSLVALDLYAPTGDYDAEALANIGRNYWALQAVYGISLIQPKGFNADLKAMWTVNASNPDTDYRSGQELIGDYALGWGFGHGWTVGVSGYLYQQISDDEVNGERLDDNRGRALAIGPSLRYDSGKGWFVNAKYSAETSVRNRAEGQAFWVKAVFPL